MKRTEKQSEERLRTLKRDIALNQYEVDAGAVADAIVSKLRLVRRGQMALGCGADRSPKAGERRPPGPLSSTPCPGSTEPITVSFTPQAPTAADACAIRSGGIVASSS